MSEIKYIIHPGNVFSKNDGDYHYISGERLIKLYNLNPKKCLIVRNPRPFSRMPFGMPDDPSYKHLYPRWDGNYSI
jgi:hypothetical protein